MQSITVMTKNTVEKNAGSTVSQIAMIKIIMVITAIPIPTTLQSFFVSYLFFSSLPAVL